MDPSAGASKLQDRVKFVLGPVGRRLWKFNLEGYERLPTSGPAILCPNHVSFLDSAFLILTLPRRISFVGKAEYLDDWKTKYVFPAMFAGAGVKGGTVLGASDKDGSRCVDTGWDKKEQPRIENVVATIYSALGIDWGKEVEGLPSGRTYAYVDRLGANGFIPTDEIASIYG